VRDRDGQQLAYVHFDNPRAAAKPLTPSGLFSAFQAEFSPWFFV